MFELLKAARVLGVRQLLRLRRAQKAVWPNLIQGHVLTRVMQTLLHAGFFDGIQKTGAVNPAAFARANQLDESILSSLCDVLYAARILDKQGDDYFLSERGRPMVDPGRGWFFGTLGYEDLYRNLDALLRREQRYGADVRRNLRLVAHGTGQIEGQLYFPLAIDIIKNNGYRRVLDLGCGDGAFLRQACGSLGSIEGRGLDIDRDLVDDARRVTAAGGLDGRIRFAAADLTRIETPPEGFNDVDVATTFFLLHEILHGGADGVVRFLRAFRRLFAGVPLIVFEVDRPSPESHASASRRHVDPLLSSPRSFESASGLEARVAPPIRPGRFRSC